MSIQEEKSPQLIKLSSMLGFQDIYGQTPLHCAISNNNYSIVLQLLEAMKIDDIIKRTKEGGYTILHMLLSENRKFTNNNEVIRYKIVKKVLDKCPQLASIPDKEGQTPLMWASSNGFTPIV